MIPKLRFPEFTDEWQTKKVRDIFKITRGYVLAIPQTRQSSNAEYAYPVYSSQTKNGGRMGYYNRYLYENAITWTTDGANAGHVNYREGRFYCTNVCGVLINNDGYANKTTAEILNRLTPKYVSYVGNPKLMNDTMGIIPVTLPAIHEQQKIANFLTVLDEKIAALEQKAEKLQDYKRGMMQKIFSQQIRFTRPDGSNFPGWETKKLGEMFTLKRGGSISKENLSPNGKFPVIHYGELFTKYHEKIDFVTSRTDFDGGVVSKIGDILMPTSDVTPQGLATASAILVENVLLGGDINILRPKVTMSPVFMSYMVNMQKKKIMRLVTGTTIRHIYASDIAKISYTLPVLDEQQKIADLLMAIDAKITLTKSQVEKTKEFKKGLLQRMFV